jgi:hypothetical protein
MSDPARDAIRQAIVQCERYGVPIVAKHIAANVDVGEVTVNYSNSVMERHIRGLIPTVLKEEGYAIKNAATGERKRFSQMTLDEWEEQIRVKQESVHYDTVRLRADKKLAEFWAEKNQDFGYDVYPELFWDDVERIYAMEGLQPPPLSSLNGSAAA